MGPLKLEGTLLTTPLRDTMRAVVLEGPGPPESLQIRQIPVPVPTPGWALIQVKAFGLNRAELHTRLGLADGVTFPRVLGIEAAGIVAACPGGEFTVGHHVVALMGGMGRVFDGGYAEYTCVPVSQVIPFTSDLDWATIGAIPEMLQTANGSLTIGLDAEPGQTLLIRGGTSSIGMATAALAKGRGMTVLSTTRNSKKTQALEAVGVDHVIIDTGTIAPDVRAILPDGVDAALELIGTPTLPDTLQATRVHGVVCFTGMLSNEWIVKDFYPIEYLPSWTKVRDEIYEEIMAKGWDPAGHAFRQHYAGPALDASNLMMPLVLFVSPTDPRNLANIEATLRKPAAGGLTSNSLVYRYNVDQTDDGLTGEDGTFNICTFWLVEALTRAGKSDPRYLKQARLIFEEMLGYANHLGLYAEETGKSGEALGNFPQAFTHLALISAAFNLDRALGDRD